jgi:phage-related protein
MGDYQLYRMLDSILENQQTIYGLLERINRKVNQEMSDLTALTTEVQNNTAVDTSAITLLNGLAAQLAAIANDPAAIQALADELSLSSASLAEAVLANTPVVVEVPVEPPVEPPVETPPV